MAQIGVQMPGGRPGVGTRPAAVRSRVTNEKPLPGSDGRSTWSRRRRDLIIAFEQEVTHPLRERDRFLIANLASIIARTEQLHVAISNGEPVDDDQLIRLSNVAARLLSSLGLNKVKHES